jgi:2-keto-4-pentenoate hydratase
MAADVSVTMTAEEGADIVWRARLAGDRAPEALRGTLTLETAYRIQDIVAARLVAAGERQTGWKIACNSDNFRRQNNGAGPISGYLFSGGAYQTGRRIDYAALTVSPKLESELCLVMKRRLGAARVTREDAAAAIGAIAPAFEIPCLPSPKDGKTISIAHLDQPMCVADNAYNMGYVLGAPVPFEVGALDLADVVAQERCNGETTQQGRARDSIDDHLEALAWLAMHLHGRGLSIEPGQHVMSGNCLPAVMTASGGQHWETTFSSVGTVSIAFV